MKSKESSKLLDLSRDLQAGAADVIALRQARQSGGMNLDAYLMFLAGFPPSSLAELETRSGPAGDEPFVL